MFFGVFGVFGVLSVLVGVLAFCYPYWVLFGILGAFLVYLLVWNSILGVLLGVFGMLVGVLGFWLVYFDY